MLGFDAISVGGVLAWLMDCLDEKLLSPDELGVSKLPVFSPDNFDLINDSMHNAQLGIELLDAIIEQKIDISEGTRKFARRLARKKSNAILDRFVYIASARNGWIVPNQYWTPGVLSPMAIMGKYYMYYGNEFFQPRKLGRQNAERLKQELILDNLGICRFHRKWAEEMMPEIIGSLFNLKDEFLKNITFTAGRINSRNNSIFWESTRNFDYIYTFMKRKAEVEGEDSEELMYWISKFEKDKKQAALDFWYEIHKGTHEILREFA